MFCKYCGNEIDEDVVVCTKCGKQVKESKYENSPNSINIDTYLSLKTVRRMKDR
ncbi:MAG: zinc-ribbon domain-containing protein [Niameybacter sp.]